ncbi:MAG: FtsX-like permease family protein [Gammaproteobacteria bacterium]|nr:FtsX-like permease family protein [Gammaproteobacteria bacterium]
MFDRLSWFLAYRYLNSKHSNNFISFISIISLLGVAIGTAILIIVLSVLNGFREHLETKLLQDQAHVIINYNTIDKLDDVVVSIFNISEQLPIKLKIYPQVKEGGLFRIGNYVIPVEIIADPNLKVNNKDDIVISDKMAKKWNLKIGDKIILAAPILKNSIIGPEPRFKRFIVKNILNSKKDMDIIMPYPSALTFFDLPEKYITGLYIYLDKPLYTEQLKNYLLKDTDKVFFGTKPKITSWYDYNNTLFQAIKIERTAVILLLLIIITVAAFNLISALYIQVSEKQKDMAILRTFGLYGRKISLIFIIQGLIIGTAGCMIGLVLGVVISYNLGFIFHWLQYTNIINSSNLFFNAIAQDEIKIIPYYFDVALVIGSALIICILATLLPAYRAGKILPIEALRNE